MRTFVVGDIHGGLKGLKEVLELVPYKVEDQFVFLGDYVDGWSEVPETLDFLMAFSQNQRCVFLRGNHDELLANYLKDKEANPAWLASGGALTKERYLSLTAEKRKNHLEFLQSLHNFYIDLDNRLYVHAGFTNQKGPGFEYFPRLVYWDRTLWETACAMNPKLTADSIYYPKRFGLFKEIFIGHTPTFKLGSYLPINRANVWNIDTGAAFKGPLTIMEAESKEYWQSTALWQLYPNESGRN